MLIPRPLIAAGRTALIGVALGAGAWAALSAAGVPGRSLARTEARWNGTPPAPADASGLSGALTDAAAMSIFRLPTGAPAAASTPVPTTLVLLGLARSPGRTAALIATGAGKPVWLELGKEAGGMTLQRVAHDRAFVSVGGAPAQELLLYPAGRAPSAPAPKPPEASALAPTPVMPPTAAAEPDLSHARLPPPPADAPKPRG